MATETRTFEDAKRDAGMGLGEQEDKSTAWELDFRDHELRSFWERVYIAALDESHRQRSVTVPWSERCAEIADTAARRWTERFRPDRI